MMIKRAVSMGMTNENEEKYAQSALRMIPMAKNQISAAFMPRDTALAFVEAMQQEKQRMDKLQEMLNDMQEEKAVD
jgi:hypothetical protein